MIARVHGGPRILFVNSSSGRGGAERHICELMDPLLGAGWDVHLASPADGPLVQAACERGARHHAVPMFPDRPSLEQGAMVRRTLREVAPDIVHLHGVRTALIGRLAVIPDTTRSRLPAGNEDVPALIYTVHGAHYLHYRPPLNRIAVGIERMLCNLTAAVVYVCRSDAEESVAAGAADSRKTVVIPNGVDVSGKRRQTDPVSRDRTRRELGLHPQEVVILFAGRLETVKNVPLLIRALHQLALRGYGDNAILLVAGAGSQEPILHELVRDLGVRRASVRFLGERDDMADLMAAADVVAIPSRWEGLPYLLLDAMANALPVVGASVGGLREAVEDGVSGRLVEPNDAPAFAAALKDLVQDKELRRRMGRHAQERARKRYRLDRMVGETLGLYHRVLTNPRRGHR
ncbi:MAG: glycosyltransferase [Thermoleophilia bacterium]